jgi:hypothetical protein
MQDEKAGVEKSGNNLESEKNCSRGDGEYN